MAVVDREWGWLDWGLPHHKGRAVTFQINCPIDRLEWMVEQLGR